MQTARIAIVGGGLSGLYAAYLLEQKGIRDYVLHEARDVPGAIEAASLGVQALSEFTLDDLEEKS